MRLALLLLVMAASVSGTYGQNRYALVIGNSKYAIENPLTNPVNDARLIDSSLKRNGFQVIRLENASFQAIEDSLESFHARIRRAPCVALFYYSGHGIQSDGENFLVPVNVSIQAKSDINTRCISLQGILDRMEASQSVTNIIILDACRKDPFTKSWYKGEGERGLTVVKKPMRESYIAYATSPGQIANDGSNGHSPFTRSLARHIDDPGPIEDVFKKVNSEVKQQYPDQIPWTNSSLGIDFSFRKESTSTTPAPDGKNTIRFFATTDCRLYINEDSIGTISTNTPRSIGRKAGTYKLKAISLTDTLNVREEEFTYDGTALNNVKILNIPQPDPGIPRVLQALRYGMIKVEGGEFDMGSSSGNYDEAPVHHVEIGSFYLSRTEVTQAQWVAVMGSNPSNFNKNCNDCPVENVSWSDAMQFIRQLNQLTQEQYRLPTEAEWEYAARGGPMKLKFKFSGGDRLNSYGWFYSNADNKTHEVSKMWPNQLSIFDMCGNVAEWCSDWYDGSYYNKGGAKDPKGPVDGKYRVVRGGSWDEYDRNCLVFTRNKAEPTTRSKSIGLRLARNP